MHEYGKKSAEHIRNILKDSPVHMKSQLMRTISNEWQKTVQKIVLGESVIHLEEKKKITKPEAPLLTSHSI